MTTLTLYFSLWAGSIRDVLSKIPSLTRICVDELLMMPTNTKVDNESIEVKLPLVSSNGLTRDFLGSSNSPFNPKFR